MKAVQKGRPLNASFVKRRSSLVENRLRHVREIRFTIHVSHLLKTPLADYFNSLLHMIAQHDLFRMRIEIDLIPNVAHVEDLDVVLDQGQRNN